MYRVSPHCQHTLRKCLLSVVSRGEGKRTVHQKQTYTVSVCCLLSGEWGGGGGKQKQTYTSNVSVVSGVGLGV